MKGIDKYTQLLNLPEGIAPFTLGEGNTPLVKSRQIGPALGFPNLYFKLESANPSGSYKDRFAAYAVADVLANKGRLCLATSSGNTGAALAAYSAAAGIPCKIAIVDGAPEGKLKQMRAYGAALYVIKGFGKNKEATEKVFNKLGEVAAENQTRLQVSAFKYSPVGMTGVQTLSFELAEDLERVDNVFVPSGGGGLTLAVARGFQRWKEEYADFEVPRVHCVQPEGNDTIAGNLRKGLDEAKAVENATTKVSGLQVAVVIDGNETLQACKSTAGNGFLVSDEETFECQRLLAIKEGIYAEPAGAVALAGFMKAVENGELDKNANAVCIVSGSGFKDPEATDNLIVQNPVSYLESYKEMDQYFAV
ncbi:pyridoxal-phosphate dependent enzyme [Cyclobacterium sp. 1_MG-2023]|uniref:threonine synthase n=1 Tax=Cyclobacterium sp. 1_MG-2023 TaxID=3062681 RepID=UPI0026E3BA54|nr:pyridoxal-phosphate dependent enzyme [Cyclobacterium sp. 1_MG-2023]MDO6439885.1 pyridoxal-phosphate dependent enzyme [Cyclobacterium sp. 1_MG-2023]